MKETDAATYMSKLYKNPHLAEYHDTLFITLMLLLKSREICSYFQRNLGQKSNSELFKAVTKIDKGLGKAFKEK